MIEKAEIIQLPASGEFQERIYYNESPWGSQHWTFVKFTNDDALVWCGHFRGFPLKVELSTQYDIILVLTNDYLYQLDRKTGDLVDLMEMPNFKDLTFAPNGDLIVTDDYNLFRFTKNSTEMEQINSPIAMENIRFKQWDGTKLTFSCVEFLNWERKLQLVYDFETHKITFYDEKRQKTVQLLTYLRQYGQKVLRRIRKSFAH